MLLSLCDVCGREAWEHLATLRTALLETRRVVIHKRRAHLVLASHPHADVTVCGEVLPALSTWDGQLARELAP